MPQRRDHAGGRRQARRRARRNIHREEDPAFNRDMFLNIPLIADWHAVTLKREH